MRTHFLLSILLRIATRFLQYLKQIDKISYTTENLLHKTMRNKELVQILGLEKSLVYFSTSLKSNEVTLEKILRGRLIKLYDEDEELLEDVIIEVKQAIEMCSIYSNVFQYDGCVRLIHLEQPEYRDEGADSADHRHGASAERYFWECTA